MNQRPKVLVDQVGQRLREGEGVRVERRQPTRAEWARITSSKPVVRRCPRPRVHGDEPARAGGFGREKSTDEKREEDGREGMHLWVSEAPARESLAWTLYQDFERERARVLSDTSLSTAEKALAEEALLEALKTAEEALGVKGVIAGDEDRRQPLGDEGGEA